MIKLFHMGVAALVVAVALVGYGRKEETAALAREIVRLEAERERLLAETEALESEWAYLNGPDQLWRIARAAYGADGPPLSEPTAAQLISLDDLPMRGGALKPHRGDAWPDTAFEGPALTAEAHVQDETMRWMAALQPIHEADGADDDAARSADRDEEIWTTEVRPARDAAPFSPLGLRPLDGDGFLSLSIRPIAPDDAGAR